MPIVKKIYDLSQPVYHACPAWPTYDLVNLNYEAHFAIHGYNAERIDMNMHTGTHVDAPFHFTPEGKTVDKIDLEKFAGRGVVLDLRQINAPAIGKEHLEPYDNTVSGNDVVILYTGWGQKRAMSREYLYEWPYLTEDAAKWLVNKSVKAVCTDGMSVGGWPEGMGEPPHRVLLKNNVVIVEELYIDEELLAEEELFVTAFPVKMQGCSGAPVRMVAMVFES